MNIARGYMTLANAARAAGGRPILRLLADPQELFIIMPSLKTSIYVLTADSPQGRHQNAGSVSAMDIVEIDIARRERPWPVLRIVDDADNPNNRRIVSDSGGPICKVYGFTPEEAQHKAEIIVGALGRPAMSAEYRASSLSEIAEAFDKVADRQASAAANYRSKRGKDDCALRATVWREAANFLRQTTLTISGHE